MADKHHGAVDLTQPYWSLDMDQLGYVGQPMMECEEQDEYSLVLGPNGEILWYAPPEPFGFDLRPRHYE